MENPNHIVKNVMTLPPIQYVQYIHLQVADALYLTRCFWIAWEKSQPCLFALILHRSALHLDAVAMSTITVKKRNVSVT